jgi:hypothetical protein
MMAGQRHAIAAICPKCRLLWQEHDEPDAILEIWHAEAVETFTRRVASELSHCPGQSPNPHTLQSRADGEQGSPDSLYDRF